MEHRGHGFSRRFLKDLHKVYVKSYQEYVKDLHVFVDGIVKKRSKSGELYLFAHSMGGAIGACFWRSTRRSFPRRCSARR